MSSAPTREAVLPRLRGSFGQASYVFVERCPSTQRLLGRADPEGAVAVADEQTEGRGRLGRSWTAPPATSVLCSVLLEPQVPSERLPELTIVGAHACVEAIAEVTGVSATIKQPNDVLIGGRKVAGVLGEASEGRVVLGTGINVNVDPCAFPDDLRLPATSLLAETNGEVDRTEVLISYLACLEQRYGAWLGA